MNVTRPYKKMAQLIKGIICQLLDGKNRRGLISTNATIKQLKAIACRIVSKFRYENMQNIKARKTVAL